MHELHVKVIFNITGSTHQDLGGSEGPDRLFTNFDTNA